MDIAEALHWMMQQDHAAILFNGDDFTAEDSQLQDQTGLKVLVTLEDRMVGSFPVWGKDEVVDPEEVLAEAITMVREGVEAA